MSSTAAASLSSVHPPPITMPSSTAAFVQGLTLVHFSVQRKRFVWDRGCIEGLFTGHFAGVRRCRGVLTGCWGFKRCISCQIRLRLS